MRFVSSGANVLMSNSKTNRTTARRESDLLITSMITDRIGRQEVLLPINQNHDKISERKKLDQCSIFQLISHKILTFFLFESWKMFVL